MDGTTSSIPSLWEQTSESIQTLRLEEVALEDWPFGMTNDVAGGSPFLQRAIQYSPRGS